MNALLPLMTHSPSVEHGRGPGAAGVAAARPASVSPNAPSARPLHRSGSHRCFCSSVPKRKIGIAPSPTPASSVMATDWSTRAELLEGEAEREVVAAHAAVLLGERQAEQAHLAHAARRRRRGRSCVGVVLRTRPGATTLSANSRRRSCASSCSSSVSWSSMAHRGCSVGCGRCCRAFVSAREPGQRLVDARPGRPTLTEDLDDAGDGRRSTCSIFIASTVTSGAATLRPARRLRRGRRRRSRASGCAITATASLARRRRGGGGWRSPVRRWRRRASQPRRRRRWLLSGRSRRMPSSGQRRCPSAGRARTGDRWRRRRGSRSPPRASRSAVPSVVRSTAREAEPGRARSPSASRRAGVQGRRGRRPCAAVPAMRRAAAARTAASGAAVGLVLGDVRSMQAGVEAPGATSSSASRRAQEGDVGADAEHDGLGQRARRAAPAPSSRSAPQAITLASIGS